MGNTTAFNKKWYDETTFRTVKSFGGIDVVFEKKVHNGHESVYLENIKTPPYFGYVPSDSSVLLKVFSPKNNDGTNEDRDKKIEDAVNAGRKFFDAITEAQIFELQKAFEHYDNAVENVYKARNNIGKTK